jgi:hypothetical protein
MPQDLNNINMGQPQQEAGIQMPEKKVVDNVDKIGSQKEPQMEKISINQQAMEMLDIGMSEMSETQNAADTIKSLIEKLGGLIPPEKKLESTTLSAGGNY